MIRLLTKINKTRRSFGYAFKGILQVFIYENNAHVHLVATILVVMAGLFFDVTRAEWLWIILAIALVWITESINTAIEKMVDFISPTYHPVAGKIKDIAAGAVLIAAVAAFIIGLFIFTPYMPRIIN